MPPAPRRPGPRHVILIGLPGSGKSTVGPLVAAELGFTFVDVDEQIERHAGHSISIIIARRGERQFRALERQTVEKCVSQVDPMVISPGGGWAAQAGTLQDVKGLAMTVYLKTSPGEAARRVVSSGGRPLLPTGQEAAGMQELLLKREANYLCADGVVTTDGRAPIAVAQKVAQLARISGAV